MALTHLAALQQLTLDAVVVDGQVCRALAEHLGALQQLRVHSLRLLQQPEELLQLFGPKLVDYTSWRVPAATHMAHLTRLVWHCEHQVPQGAAEALAALTGLQELTLEGCLDGSAAGDVMQALAGMVQLRRLQLSGTVEPCRAQPARLPGAVHAADGSGVAGHQRDGHRGMRHPNACAPAAGRAALPHSARAAAGAGGWRLAGTPHRPHPAVCYHLAVQGG